MVSASLFKKELSEKAWLSNACMNDIYVTKSGMTKEQMFRLRLINGFNFAPIIADAIVDLSKDFFQNDDSRVCDGQILYLAISDEEDPGKSIRFKAWTTGMCLIL